jgi:hypothetical protein
MRSTPSSSLASTFDYVSRPTYVAAPAAVGCFPLLAVFVYVADEHPAFYTGARTLEAGAVRLYGVVLMLGGWVRWVR